MVTFSLPMYSGGPMSSAHHDCLLPYLSRRLEGAFVISVTASLLPFSLTLSQSIMISFSH